MSTGSSCVFRAGTLLLLVMAGIAAASAFAQSDALPNLAPTQQDTFFKHSILNLSEPQQADKPMLEPYFSFSHDAREENPGIWAKLSVDRILGEAGGKLNLFGNSSITTFAKIPVYKKETVERDRTNDSSSSTELLKKGSGLSWRSELSIPFDSKKGINIFYDNSTYGQINKPGVEERDERFGTRFIFKFK